MCSQQLQNLFIWNEYDQFFNIFFTKVYNERRQKTNPVSIIHSHHMPEYHGAWYSSSELEYDGKSEYGLVCQGFGQQIESQNDFNPPTR